MRPATGSAVMVWAHRLHELLRQLNIGLVGPPPRLQIKLLLPCRPTDDTYLDHLICCSLLTCVHMQAG